MPPNNKSGQNRPLRRLDLQTAAVGVDRPLLAQSGRFTELELNGLTGRYVPEADG